MQDIDTYLHGLVQSKRLLSLIMLVCISIAMVYIPYGAILTSLLRDVPIVMKAIIKALVYTVPIIACFRYVFKDVQEQIFQKVSWSQHLLCVVFACILVLFVNSWAIFLDGLISINPSDNVMGKKSQQDMILSIPGLLVQLFGENIMFISFLLFWYKCMTYTKIKSQGMVIGSIILAGITFGMMHLTAYQFNFLQCILIIGITASLQLVWFAEYKNAHMAFWLHVYYDLILILWGVLG
ncbi:hypothetical protein IIU_07024 [Bacillus cereus VD133]|uniref:CAAX amino protease n=1 Tax=Bacillus cereus VD133 TaxID=1053233 RepID=A0A9W5PJ64_BACCE|nr:hypothetical protein [Bacillus cereus]EOO23528.1 hypothetical protein IIU_07024 [Bacillus cereus VD133]